MTCPHADATRIRLDSGRYEWCSACGALRGPILDPQIRARWRYPALVPHEPPESEVKSKDNGQLGDHKTGWFPV